jgi:hypothetical protein
MISQTSAHQLTLADLRRLISETSEWSGKCSVQLFASTNVDRVTVEEHDIDRHQKQPTKAAATAAAPVKASKRATS